MIDLEEAAQTVQRLQKVYEDLAVRGLRSVGGDQLSVLAAISEELERVGSAHLAGRVETLITMIRNNDRGSARALMRAQSSLRIFDRILTLQGAEAQLSTIICSAGSPDPGSRQGGVTGESEAGAEGDDDSDADDE
jgi:hypothetical protein